MLAAAGGPPILRGNVVALETGPDNQVTAVRIQQPLGQDGPGWAVSCANLQWKKSGILFMAKLAKWC